MIFRNKAYHRLCGLRSRWEIPESDMHYAIENSLLRVCIFLPLRYVECGVMQGETFVLEHHEDKDGIVAVRPEDYHLVNREGEARLRIFYCTHTQGRVFRLAMEPRQVPVTVQPHDFLVLQEDRIKFEETLRPASQGGQ